MSKKSSKQAEVKVVETAFVPAELYKRSEDQTISKAGRLYNLRRESRLCVKCGGVLDESSNLLCTKHLDYYNNWHAAKKQKLSAQLARLAELEAQLSEQGEVVQTTKKSNRQARKSK